MEQNVRQPHRRMVPVSPRWGLAFAAVLSLLAVVVWLPWRGDRARQTSRSVENKPPSSTRESVLYVLEPGLLRSGAGNQINVPATAEMAQFDLNTGNSLPGSEFEAILGTPENPDIWKGAAVRKDHRLSVSVPASLLAIGDYTLRVFAASNSPDSQAVATYYFRVIKPPLHPGQL